MELGAETAAALAHEVKNPLSLIKMNVDYIKSCLDKEFDDNFEIIEREIGRISNIVTGLTFNRQPVYLRALLRGILGEYDISLKHKSIAFDIDCDTDIFVQGDYEKLNILFFNLIKNSVEAIDESGEVKISIERGKNEIRVCIEDTGKGISPEIMERIGQPYNTDKTGGTGLGLAICKSIVNEHRGSIAFENTEKGCRVTVGLKA